jgi:hypothetical protein
VDPNIVSRDQPRDASIPLYGPTHPFRQRVEIDVPTEIWLVISDKLKWPQAILLSHTCRHFTPLRQALDAKLQHLRMPDLVAEGILSYRKQKGSKHIKGLIMADGRRNTRARNMEVEAGLDIFGQWWRSEPPAAEAWREPQHQRHSDLGYAVMCARNDGTTRYWRARAVSRLSGGTPPLEAAYKAILTREANEILEGL